MKKFVALYGGSFNLSTLAHRAVGAAVRDLVKPDEVWYLVSPQNPHKSKDHMADFRDRVEMAKLNVCGLDKLIVTDIEKEISEKTGSTATADTLRELKTRYPDIHFTWVVGASDFIQLHTWHDSDYILQNFPIVVVPRAGFTAQVATCPAAAKIKQLSATEELKGDTGWYLLHQFPEGNISATDERKKVANGHQPTRNVHPAVMDYITRHRLNF